MNAREVLDTTTFRLAAAFATFFAGAILLLFAFIYWNTAVFERHRIDLLITNDLGILANEPEAAMLQLVETRVTSDFHRVSYAGLFDETGRRIAGNLVAAPSGLTADGAVHIVRVAPLDRQVASPAPVRAAERRLANGDILVIGRNTESLDELRGIVLRALALGVIPAVFLSLAAGAFLSLRAQKRVQEVYETAERIRLGHLRERLPVRGARDDFDRLAIGVNRMLDEIERLLHELRATGDEIAHDLRTPLTRVRARLERGLAAGGTHEDLVFAVERAILGLDQALIIITALLRIREIEAGQRRSGFGAVDLDAIVRSIEELYGPIAEEKGVAFAVASTQIAPVDGDRDLLMEAIGNLVDNAVKFTPTGGAVLLQLLEEPDAPVVRIRDTGPGIAEPERAVVFSRFYRSPTSRKYEGAGLGLSLVAAIANLHQARIVIADGDPGCVVELRFARR